MPAMDEISSPPAQLQWRLVAASCLHPAKPKLDIPTSAALSQASEG